MQAPLVWERNMFLPHQNVNSLTAAPVRHKSPAIIVYPVMILGIVRPALQVVAVIQLLLAQKKRQCQV